MTFVWQGSPVEWVAAVTGRTVALPPELAQPPDSVHDARAWHSWAEACRLWWCRTGLPESTALDLWGVLVAARLHRGGVVPPRRRLPVVLAGLDAPGYGPRVA